MKSKEDLRKECARFFRCESIYDSHDLIDIYSGLLLKIVSRHHEEPVYSSANADAKMILQMMLTKTLHLKTAVDGVSFSTKEEIQLNKIIDPTIVATLIRNLYETVSLFNLIYRHTKTPDEKAIVYGLWVHSGLQYRQRFESLIMSEESLEKKEKEKKQLEEIVIQIESIELFKQLDEKNKGKIKNRLKGKEYLIAFEGTNVKFLHWQELTKIMQLRSGIFDYIYTYFSLYSHPSNVSVFQFGDMFKNPEEGFLSLTNFNLRYYFALASIFIADYIKLFPTVQKTFDSLNLRDQIVINFHNTFSRGMEYSINESWKIVD
jgi:hypothetical protein